MSANSGIPLGQWSGSDATDRLRETIIELNAATDRQTRTMVRLTWALIVSTVILTIGVAVEIWLALRVD